MVLSLVPAILGVLITVLLAAGATLSRALTPLAGAVAAVFGSIIVVTVGFPFLALMVLFVVGSVVATRYQFDQKKRSNVQEGRAGERGVSNVLAHILIPTGLALITTFDAGLVSASEFAVLYSAALAFGASDTFASEFGVLSQGARSILTFRKVVAGTNGGVTAYGEAWAFVGAGTTALIAFGLILLARLPSPGIAIFLLAVIAAGFLGCQVDSVLGEVLENRGFLTKHSTNFGSMLISVLIAGTIVRVVG
ncbi:MAG: DUF92 domain-containing protein [Thermoplasmata archaeon]